MNGCPCVWAWFPTALSSTGVGLMPQHSQLQPPHHMIGLSSTHALPWATSLVSSIRYQLRGPPGITKTLLSLRKSQELQVTSRKLETKVSQILYYTAFTCSLTLKMKCKLLNRLFQDLPEKQPDTMVLKKKNLFVKNAGANAHYRTCSRYSINSLIINY